MLILVHFRLQNEFLKMRQASNPTCFETSPLPNKVRSEEKGIGVPNYVNEIKGDQELGVGMELSRSMWISNPGYLQREGSKMASFFKTNFVWNQDEVNLIFVNVATSQ